MLSKTFLKKKKVEIFNKALYLIVNALYLLVRSESVSLNKLFLN